MQEEEKSRGVGSASVTSSGAGRARIYERSWLAPFQDPELAFIPVRARFSTVHGVAAQWLPMGRSVLPYRTLNYAPARFLLARKSPSDVGEPVRRLHDLSRGNRRRDTWKWLIVDDR